MKSIYIITNTFDFMEFLNFHGECGLEIPLNIFQLWVTFLFHKVFVKICDLSEIPWNQLVCVHVTFSRNIIQSDKSKLLVFIHTVQWDKLFVNFWSRKRNIFEKECDRTHQKCGALFIISFFIPQSKFIAMLVCVTWKKKRNCF